MDKQSIAERLAEARERTWMLIEPLDESQLNTVYSDLLSPLAWDLGHIANFEELWLVQAISGREPLDGHLGQLYDAVETPRSGRSELPILRDAELRAYMADVRERALYVLESVEFEDPSDPLLHNGFVYEMLIAHEHQHNETMLQLLQHVEGYACPLFEPAAPSPGAPPFEMVVVPAGTYSIGTPAGSFAYDNERAVHEVTLASSEIDRYPISNEQYANYVAEGGGQPPMFWQRDSGEWWLDTRFGGNIPVDPGRPVVHVSFNDAASYAEWVGKRLPTEFEWEVAAAGSDFSAANLNHTSGGTAPLGSLGAGASDLGVEQMIGDAWEWTSSEFSAYPGFEPFPYEEYSEVFLGEGYSVLRGGAWATRPGPALRLGFRNWDLPIRKQIFAGFRCANDLKES